MKTKLTCGIDEAGRGAFAGPLVTAAVVFKEGFDFEQITDLRIRDSKEMTAPTRIKAYNLILENCVCCAFEVLTVEEINGRGINWANLEGFARLIKRMKAHSYIIDGRWKLDELWSTHGIDKKCTVTCEIGGDRFIPAVMAAGIVAKIERDKIMHALDFQYPEYKWRTNTGHGTKEHIEALLEYGKTRLHRTMYIETGIKNFYARGNTWKKNVFGLG